MICNRTRPGEIASSSWPHLTGVIRHLRLTCVASGAFQLKGKRPVVSALYVLQTCNYLHQCNERNSAMRYTHLNGGLTFVHVQRLTPRSCAQNDLIFCPMLGHWPQHLTQDTARQQTTIGAMSEQNRAVEHDVSDENSVVHEPTNSTFDC